MSTAPGLAAWLRELPDDRLADLLRARPDLAVPPPRDSTALASRAGSLGSLTRAVETLDALELQVLDGLLLLPGPHSRDGLVAALGEVLPEAEPAELDRARATLERLGLVLGDAAGHLHPVRGLDHVRAYPAGLGRPGAAIAGRWLDAAGLAARLARLDDGQRELLGQLAHGSTPLGTARGVGRIAALPAGPLRSLLEARLLLAAGADLVELPREVGLALRGPLPLGPTRTPPPADELARVEATSADRAGAGVAAELVRAVATLLDAWGADPPATLRAGGLGVRDLKAAARLLGRSEAEAALVAELAFGASLLDEDPQEGCWAPTPAYDAWLGRPLAERWVVLGTTWVSLPRLPALAGRRDERDKPIAALGPGTARVAAREERRSVLAALAAVPAGGVATAEVVGDWLAYRAPLRAGPGRQAFVEDVLAEAALVGITGRGAVTTFGRVMLAGEEEAAAAALASRLPPQVDHVLAQADLTVIAPGPLRDDMASELALMADVESTGAATVYRFSEASVRRALDAGEDAAALHAFLARHSRTPVPQALTYLVDDVARRHGRLRTGAATSYLRAEDPALVAEVLAHRGTAKLHLRRIAPTVAVSTAPVARVLDGLRAAGYAPVAESRDGAAVLSRRSARRIPARRRWTGAEPASLPTEQLGKLVTRIRAGDAAPPSEPPGLAAALDVLGAAVTGRARVRLGYLDQSGTERRTVVQPEALGNGQLLAYDESVRRVRWFPLHRVTAAARVG